MDERVTKYRLDKLERLAVRLARDLQQLQREIESARITLAVSQQPLSLFWAGEQGI